MKEYSTETLTRLSGSSISSDEDYSIIYIVRGEISAEINGQLRRTSKGEFFFLNPGESAEIHWMHDSLAIRLVIEPGYLHEKSRVNSIYFSFVEGKYTSKDLVHTGELIKKFLILRTDLKEKGGYGELGAYFSLIDNLIKYYCVEDINSEISRDDYGARMLRYVHLNYRNHICLDEIAEQLFISAPTASRIFYEKAGIKFGDYLRNYRLSKAKQALEKSEESITSIALNAGFGSPSVMNKVFLKYIGITPSEYRTGHRIVELDEDAQEEILFKALSEDTTERNTQKLSVDLSEESASATGLYHPQVLNVGSMKTLGSAQMQKQVTAITESLNIKHVRLWGLFGKDMHLLTDKKGVYNFSFMDEILDYIVDNDLYLFADIGLRGDGTRANENTMVFEEQNFIVFHSKKEWLHMLECFLDHISYRYGRAVNNWIIEVSFFLNNIPYYEGKGYSSTEVWDETAALIRSKIPDMKVVGPGMPLVSDKEINRMWIEHLLSAKQKPDYITCISFPYNDSIRNDINDLASYKELSTQEFRRSSNISDIEVRVKDLMEILRENNYSGGCILTDWNYSISNRNYLQDSTYRAAFTAQCMINNMNNIDVFGIFYASDLLSAYSDTKTVLQGSSGIMTRDGIEKPVFHVFKFLNQLGRHTFLKTDNCLVTGDSEGREIKILVYNCQPPDADYYLLSEDAFKPSEVAGMFSNEKETINLELKGLQLGKKVQIHQNILNEKHGSVLHHWLQMGCSHNLSREDLQYLKNVSVPETVIEEMVLDNSTVKLNLELESNEVRLIRITSATSI